MKIYQIIFKCSHSKMHVTWITVSSRGSKINNDFCNFDNIKINVHKYILIIINHESLIIFC